MASVEALLVALRDRSQEYVDWQRASSSCPLNVWGHLARNVVRVLELVDGPTELGPILQQLATAPGSQMDGDESPLTGMALTLGVLADTLGSSPGVVRTASLMDRSQLRSSVLASIHAAAHASVARAAPHEPLIALPSLRDLADSTEAASHVPPRPLQGALSLVRIAPEPGSLDEAMTRWAVVAIQTLSSPTRATKFAFQRTAVSIARLCWVGASDLASRDATGGEGPHARASLLAAFESWQAAADWPSELRLDGRSGDLRESSQHLESALSAWSSPARQGQLPELSSALLIASQVGAVHEEALRQRAAAGGLWIIADALGSSYLSRHPGTHRSDWLPVPGSHYCTGLIQAAERANADLGVASRDVRSPLLNHVTDVTAEPEVWERVTPTHNAYVERPPRRALSTQAMERLGRRIDLPRDPS